jgi:hypothetical protein
MNPMRLFWGILLTGFGVLIIASQLGYVSSNFWVNLLYLWPVILIVIGLRFIVHDDTIFTVVMLAILAVSGVFAAKGSFPGLPEFSEQNTYSQNITEKADS